jgi:hypothetical protein
MCCCVNNTYFVVYNMLTKKLHKRINNIQDRILALQSIGPQEFGINNIMSMDLLYRKEIMGNRRSKLRGPFRPYSRTIDGLHKVRDTESLICKLEYLYRLFTVVLTNELREFWNGEQFFSSDKLFVDADSLKGLLIYVLIQTQSAKLLIDII